MQINRLAYIATKIQWMIPACLLPGVEEISAYQEGNKEDEKARLLGSQNVSDKFQKRNQM